MKKCSAGAFGGDGSVQQLLSSYDRTRFFRFYRESERVPVSVSRQFEQPSLLVCPHVAKQPGRLLQCIMDDFTVHILQFREESLLCHCRLSVAEQTETFLWRS